MRISERRTRTVSEMGFEGTKTAARNSLRPDYLTGLRGHGAAADDGQVISNVCQIGLACAASIASIISAVVKLGL